MTQVRNTAASRPAVRPKRSLPSNGAAGRGLRARIEPMAVRPLRDGRYVVETDGGTYVADVDARACTCPDHSIRGSRCKHLRRVAIEITERLVPAPNERTAVCAVCGDRTFVPMSATGPQLCGDHAHAPGDLVHDRENGSLLLVVEATGERADEATTDDDRRIADYESNEQYGRHEPVFEAVYLDDVESNRGAADVAGFERRQSASLPDVSRVAQQKRYGFPASRLRRVERDYATVGGTDRGTRTAQTTLTG